MGTKAEPGEQCVVLGGYSEGQTSAVESLQILRRDVSSPFGWTRSGGLALTNPTYGVYGHDGQMLYTSHSGQGYLSAVAVDAGEGTLRLLNSSATGSINPAHLNLSPDGRFVIAASFTSGHVSVLPVHANGELESAVAVLSTAAEGGPFKGQTGSQPHQIIFSPEGNHVLVPDRGCDRVLVYRFDQLSGHLEPVGAAHLRPGAGPRHMVFSPMWPRQAYLVNELDNTVTVMEWDDSAERLTPLQVTSTLPSTFFGTSSGAAIEISRDGRFLFVSNRGHDSIASFSVSADGLDLTPLGWTPVGGRTPRFIALNPEGTQLWVTAQDSSLVQRFAVNASSGRLTLRASTPFPAPAFVAFT